jgi:hypothetical protein
MVISYIYSTCWCMKSTFYERQYQFIVQYTSLRANWLSMEVIWGKAKDYWQLSDCQLITMTFN